MGRQALGTNMQKPIRGNTSGLFDTMWDIIVNAAGGLFVSLVGWRYMMRKNIFFVRDLIGRFIRKNPAFFRKNGGLGGV